MPPSTMDKSNTRLNNQLDNEFTLLNSRRQFVDTQNKNRDIAVNDLSEN